MTWYPMSHMPVQYVDLNGAPYSGAVLKAYSAETSANIPMATGADGATRATTVTLNASGYPVSAGGAVIITYIQENFKLYLYPDQASADADSGELWSVDDVPISSSLAAGFRTTFSGDGVETVFSATDDLGTDADALLIFVKETNVGLFDIFEGDGTETTFTLSRDVGTDEKELQVFVDAGVDNHVANGTFATDTVWNKGANWVIGAGVATATLATSGINQTSVHRLVEGQRYECTFTITRSAGTVAITVGGTSGTVRNASNTYVENIIAGASQNITVTGVGFTGTVDNVIIRPVGSRGFDLVDPDLYTITDDQLVFDTAPPDIGTDNIYVTIPTKPGTNVHGLLPSTEYTVDGNDITFNDPPPLGTDNITVFAPSLLLGAVTEAAAAAAISEANAAASAALAASYSVPLSVITADQAAVSNNGYITNKGTRLVLTLPATSTVGETIQVFGMGAGGWRLAQNAGQNIRFNELSTTVGAGGTIDSAGQYDTIALRCVVANTTWQVLSSSGDFDII